MKKIIYPDKAEWADMLRRPALHTETLRDTVKEVLDRVKSEGDRAVIEYEERFEGPSINIWIKRGFFDVYELINMSIETINKHGKNISLLYRDETEEG